MIAPVMIMEESIAADRLCRKPPATVHLDTSGVKFFTNAALHG
jgi:hypothetical protein